MLGAEGCFHQPVEQAAGSDREYRKANFFSQRERCNLPCLVKYNCGPVDQISLI